MSPANALAKGERTSNNVGFLRLLLAIAVIWSHSQVLVDGDTSKEPLFHLTGSINTGTLAVDCFFLLSGYLITQSWQFSAGAGDYLRKRLLRIYPGFCVAFLVSLLLVGPLTGGHLSSLVGIGGATQMARMLLLRGPSLEGALDGIPDPQLNSSMWTVAYEFRCYLLTIALGYAGLIRNRVAYAAFAAALLTACLALRGISPQLPLPLEALLGQPTHTLTFAMLFAAGATFYLFKNRIPLNGALAAAAAILTALSLFLPALAEAGVATFGAYAMFWFCFGFRSRRIGRIGTKVDMSYGVYLYAWPIQSTLIWLDHGISPNLLFFAATTLSCALAALSWRLVEAPALALKRRRPAIPLSLSGWRETPAVGAGAVSSNPLAQNRP